MEISTGRTFEDILTQCPNTEDQVQCPVLERDLVIARESSGEVFIGSDVRDRDASQQRVARIMQSASNHLVGRLCEDCPKNT
ncbi:MAG: hypothetical protein WDN66_03340 [Candidatus Saccharibacteria bacterium]